MSLHLQAPTPINLGGFTKPSNLHLDILLGKDEEINVGDIYIGTWSLSCFWNTCAQQD